MSVIREACVGSLAEAVKAQENGADRIELCASLIEGGITPSYGTLFKAKELIKIPVFVMIRPRGGSFSYTDDEVDIMMKDIEFVKELGFEGVVFGLLNEKNEIDYENCERLVKIAKPLKITFHMAFDELINKKEALSCLIDLGFDRILTRGGEKSALDGLKNLNELRHFSKGKIIILPGGGITKDNAEIFIDAGFEEIHGTKVV